jgi:hypothetical protein
MPGFGPTQGLVVTFGLLNDGLCLLKLACLDELICCNDLTFLGMQHTCRNKHQQQETKYSPHWLFFLKHSIERILLTGVDTNTTAIFDSCSSGIRIMINELFPIKNHTGKDNKEITC